MSDEYGTDRFRAPVERGNRIASTKLDVYSSAVCYVDMLCLAVKGGTAFREFPALKSAKTFNERLSILKGAFSKKCVSSGVDIQKSVWTKVSAMLHEAPEDRPSVPA